MQWKSFKSENIPLANPILFLSKQMNFLYLPKLVANKALVAVNILPTENLSKITRLGVRYHITEKKFKPNLTLSSFIRASKVQASTQRCVFPWYNVVTVERTLKQRLSFFRSSTRLDFLPTIDVYSLLKKSVLFKKAKKAKKKKKIYIERRNDVNSLYSVLQNEAIFNQTRNKCNFPALKYNLFQ